MTATDQHKLWILSLGFKNNTSADFKAWIMYNNPDTYSSTKQLSIRYSDLNVLKDTHNYTSLKGTIDAPWFKFLHKLRNNTYTTTELNHDTNNNNDDSNIDWKLKYTQLLKETNTYKDKYLSVKNMNKALNNTITKQRNTIKYYTEHKNKTEQEIQLITRNFKEIQTSLTNKINTYEDYINKCYQTMLDFEKQYDILKLENDSFKQNFSNISSSQLSSQTISTLQQKYEKLSFPQYPTIICPITQEIMVEPVIAFDGQSYEKTAIEQWFQSNNKSPSNGTELSSRILIANHSLRKLIAEITSST